MVQRLTEQEYADNVEAVVKKTYDENVELLKEQYQSWQDYFCWVVAMLEADFMLQACNQKDLAGILLKGFKPFTYESSRAYIVDQYTNIVNDDEELVEQGIDELDQRIEALLGDPADDHEEF